MTLMGVAFVPFYIHALGVEAFGLIGFMLSLQALSQLFDFGVGGALNRELARRSQLSGSNASIRNLVRTFEWLIWPMSLLIFAGIWLASTPIANHWLHPQHISRADTANAICIMGLAIAALWPTTFYSSGMYGLERQTTLNLINAVFATLRNAGVLPVLYWISSTISTFFWWFAIVGICQSLVIAVALWHALPGDRRRAVFQLAELRGSWHFAGGLFTITVLSLGVTQIDRLTLSAMRPLAELGYYGVAISVTAGVGRMIQPMFNAVYPRFSRLVAAKQERQLIELYHLSNQCLSVVVAAVSVILIAFGRDVLYLWTGDHVIASQAAIPLAILVAGTALNGVMHLPYALQLANGWTRLAIASNSIALVLGIPFTLWAVATHGMTGAACLWLLVNAGSFLLGVPFMHRRLLSDEMWAWYFRDILPPFLATTAAVLTIHWFMPVLNRSWEGLFLLATISIFTLCISALASPALRNLGSQWVSKKLAS